MQGGPWRRLSFQTAARVNRAICELHQINQFIDWTAQQLFGLTGDRYTKVDSQTHFVMPLGSDICECIWHCHPATQINNCSVHGAMIIPDLYPNLLILDSKHT